MNLKSLEVKNFLGIGSGKLTFDKSGLTLVEGINHDSPSATSNGAGKSSIAEALFWVLFGKTRRGLTGDDVINETAGKNCEVILLFDDIFGEYKIHRFRKLGKEKESGLRFYSRLFPVEVGQEFASLTKGSIKDTQELIEDYIKMSELTFSKIAYFGQADIKSFANMTDSELKQVFEQALGLSCFSQYYDNAKRYKNSVEGEAMKIMLELEKCSVEAEHLSEKIELLNRQLAELIENRKMEIRRLKEQGDSIDRKIIEAAEKISEFKEGDDILEKTAELNEQRVKKHELEKLKSKLEGAYQDKASELVKLKTETNIKLRQVEERKKELSSISEKVGKACLECGKVVEKSDIAKHAEQIEKSIKALLGEFDKMQPEEKDLTAEVEKLKSLFAPLEEKIKLLSGADIELAKIEERKRGREREKTLLQSSLDALKSTKKEIASLLLKLEEKIETTGIESSIKGLEIDKAHHIKRLTDLATKVKELQAEIEGAEMLVDIMGNGGLKSYIFDSVTPELNRIISEYMSIMNPDIDIEVSTVSKTKAGDFREKFAIIVNNKNGASSFAGSSGGERQLINLAIALGFNTICRAMSEGTVNTLFLDEPLESLDEANSENAINLLQTFVSTLPNVFIVAHNPAVRDLVAGNIKVEKTGGMAKFAA